MGMCKECKGVFPPTELQDGLCKNCITPEKIAKQKRKQSSEDIVKTSDDYGTAIFISKLVSFIGWIAVIGGALLTLILLVEGGMALAGLAPAISAVPVGLILVISGQASRAVMDNANYSKAMLKVMLERS